MNEKYCKKCNKKLCYKNITFLCHSCTMKGRKFSAKHKQNLSKSHIGNKLSKEHKKAIGNGNLGKKRTKQQRLNISNSLKGKKFSKERKNKLRLSHIGKKHTEERKNNMSMARRNWLKDNDISLETRQKIGNKHRGKKSHFWKGGITKVSIAIRESLQYKEWIKHIYKRDNYTCQHCGNKSCKGNSLSLEVHHIKAFSEILKEYNIKSKEDSFLCKELWDTSNGILLCINCHKLTGNYGRPKKYKK